jgi:uncharacterized protein YjbI with pentapeptide repeats
MLTTKMIGNKIAEARKKTNVTQGQIARLLFVSPQAVGKWERGESLPDIITFNRLADILGVDLNYFSEHQRSEGEEAAVTLNKEPGDGGQTAEEAESLSAPVDRQVLTNFNGSNLPGSDFAGVTAHKGKFEGSMLRGADFSGADLTGSKFTGSDLREGNFNGANLTDCNFWALDLSGSSFRNTILVRTTFGASGLDGARFADVRLTDVKLTVTDLRKTAFENCIFDGTDFGRSDLRGMCLDRHAFIGVSFDNTALKGTSFRGATFKNVAFRATLALTNKYYRAIKTIVFDGASMDKLTFNALRGMGADLSQVTIIQ